MTSEMLTPFLCNEYNYIRPQWTGYWYKVLINVFYAVLVVLMRHTESIYYKTYAQFFFIFNYMIEPRQDFFWLIVVNYRQAVVLARGPSVQL